MQPLIHVLIHNDDGTTTLLELPSGSYVLGRETGCDIQIASAGVSRKHARLVLSEDAIEVEDLGSRAGTKVGNVKITDTIIAALPCSVNLGHLLIEISCQTTAATPLLNPISTIQLGDANLAVSLCMPLASNPLPTLSSTDNQAQKRLRMLYDLPLQLAKQNDLSLLFELILQSMLDLIPGAVRGAVLVKDANTNELLIRASVPAEVPPISRTLIQRTMEEQVGFIWGNEEADQQNLSGSMVSIGIRTGMYAPLVWNDESIGVLFVDNPKTRKAFHEEDLPFLISVAQYAASAVATKTLQNEIEQNNRTLQNLLTNFSPKVRRHLLQKSREGRLQPGGVKSTVTILLSDLRGFTKTSAALDAQVVVDMLNDYFDVLGHEIFAHDGTIDKFIGDAILAVFGSPDPDSQHAWKAVSAAIEMQNQVDEVNARRRAAGLPFCEMGIGIYTGEVLHGFIGTEDRLEYTVIGDTVNKASRYCTGAQAGEIVLGPLTYETVQNQIPATLRMIPTKHEGELPAYVVG